MKRIIISAAVLIMALAAKAQETEVMRTSLEDIDQGWASKSISNVLNGSLGIML